MGLELRQSTVELRVSQTVGGVNSAHAEGFNITDVAEFVVEKAEGAPREVNNK